MLALKKMILNVLVLMKGLVVQNVYLPERHHGEEAEKADNEKKSDYP